MNIPEPWDSILFLSLLFFTPFAAIYLLVGKSKWFRTFCKLWSFSIVFGLVALVVLENLILATCVGVITAIVILYNAIDMWIYGNHDSIYFYCDENGKRKLDENGNTIYIKLKDLKEVKKNGRFHPNAGNDGHIDNYDSGYNDNYDGGYVAPIVTEVHHYHESAERPIEHKPFPERKPAAPPPPRPEPVRQKSYKVQRMDRGGYWSTKYTTNNMRIAEQQMRNYMNGAYRLQDERQPNVRWRIVDEDDRVVF